MKHEDGAARRDSINDLDCIACGRWFPTFDRLAKHMYARHGSPSPLSAARIKGVQTDPAEPIVQSAALHEDEAMAKKKVAKRSASGGGIPAPRKVKNGESDFNPFLKAQNIGKKAGTTGALVLTGKARMADGDFGEQIICETKFGRDVFDWGITVDSPNHRMLFDRFGKDPKKWRGTVNVVIKVSTQGRPYIAVMRSK